MAGRKIRDEQDARRCMAAAKRAGISRGEWARQNGIDGRSLFAWGKNLERGGRSGRAKGSRPPRKRLGLVELIAEDRTPSRYIVRHGQVAIELDEHFDEQVLVRLLKVVTAC